MKMLMTPLFRQPETAFLSFDIVAMDLSIRAELRGTFSHKKQTRIDRDSIE